MQSIVVDELLAIDEQARTIVRTQIESVFTRLLDLQFAFKLHAKGLISFCQIKVDDAGDFRTRSFTGLLGLKLLEIGQPVPLPGINTVAEIL